MKLYAVLALVLHMKIIYSRKDGMKENLEERTNEERTTVDERKEIYKKADPCGCMSLL